MLPIRTTSSYWAIPPIILLFSTRYSSIVFLKNTRYLRYLRYLSLSHQRVGLVLSGDVRSGPVARLENAGTVGVSHGSRREHAEGTHLRWCLFFIETVFFFSIKIMKRGRGKNQREFIFLINAKTASHCLLAGRPLRLFWFLLCFRPSQANENASQQSRQLQLQQ